MKKHFLVITIASAVTMLSISCKDLNESNVYAINSQFSNQLVLEEPVKLLTCESNDVETIEVPGSPERYDLYGIIDTVCYIPLETRPECLIGTIDKIVSDASLMFVLDKQNNFVFRFSEGGRFLGRIGDPGREEGMHLKVQDIALNPKEKTITLLDTGNAKLLVYDYEGHFIREMPTFYHFNQMAYVDDMLAEYTFMADNSRFPPIDKFSLLISEKEQMPVYTGFPYTSQQRESFHWFSSKPLNAVNGEVFYHEILSDTIWELSRDACRARYCLLFPDRIGQQKKRDINTDVRYSGYLKKGQHFNGDYSFTKSCISLLIGEKQTITPLFFDRQSGKVLYGNAFSAPRNNLFEAMRCDVFNFSDGEFFIKVIQPFDILRLLKLNKRIVLSQQEQALVNSIKEEDNPILVKVKLKHF